MHSNKLDVPKLLNINYQQLEPAELSEFIQTLRGALCTLKMRNDFLLKRCSYLPEINSHYNINLFDREMIDFNHFWAGQFLDQFDSFYAITITFDPQKFKQILIVPDSDQIVYIEKCIQLMIEGGFLTDLYGCFEYQKNGTIHFHGVFSSYKYPYELEKTFLEYFTNKIERQYAIKIKPVDNLQKWISYINKESTFFISYNIKKRTLDL